MKWAKIYLFVAMLLSTTSYFVYRAHIRSEIKATFSGVANAFQETKHKQIFVHMTHTYRANHSIDDAIKFWDQLNNWYQLEDGWSLTLSLSFKEAWVYPFDGGFFELWNGPQYQLLKNDGEWLFTGETKLYLG